MTKEEIQNEMLKLAEKFVKLKQIAEKLGDELNKVSQEYHKYEKELKEIDDGQ
jgi:DNA anti-recombination protein RmuC